MNEMNTNKATKTLADLNLLDRFLFSEAAENQEFMELLLEIILGEDIILKQLPQTEKEERKALWNRQVRLDVMAVDMDEKLYDTEVQKKDRNVSQELIDLLKYFEETTDAVAEQSDSDKIHKMQQIVESIRANENVGVKFMNAWEEKILDRQEAQEEIKLETALRMKEKGFEYEVISEITHLSVEEIESL